MDKNKKVREASMHRNWLDEREGTSFIAVEAESIEASHLSSDTYLHIFDGHSKVLLDFSSNIYPDAQQSEHIEEVRKRIEVLKNSINELEQHVEAGYIAIVKNKSRRARLKNK